MRRVVVYAISRAFLLCNIRDVEGEKLETYADYFKKDEVRPGETPGVPHF